jgi:AhpD family alkylhydroperoxidase
MVVFKKNIKLVFYGKRSFAMVKAIFQPRTYMNYAEISKETIGFLYQSRTSLNKSPLSATIRVLAELRVSQINKCAYCCDLHTKEAQKLGVQDEKLDCLPSWDTSDFFTGEEKVVLRWVESVTRLDENLQELRERLSEIYSERQIVDLTACIGIMNALNRIVISLRG